MEGKKKELDTRGQFKMGTRGSVCSGISSVFPTNIENEKVFTNGKTNLTGGRTIDLNL